MLRRPQAGLAAKCSRKRRAKPGSEAVCSCTPVRPHSMTVSTTSSKPGSTKTPNFSIVFGSSGAISFTCAHVTCRGLSAKTKPTASAPASTASWASSRQVLAQILIHMRLTSARNQRRFRVLGTRKQPFQRHSWIGLAHQRLADQECVEAGTAEQVQVVGGVNAALRHMYRAFRQLRGKTERYLEA